MKIVSKKGRSFAFDERATGYGRGEGYTGVVLKPLSAALRDGNHVRAVIRNSVLNQDGRTPGISVPSAVAQKEAISKAYRQAKLDLYVDYVDMHGTGTKIGDPIEVSVIAAALSQGRMSDRKFPMGSIKGNIRHTEGVAGLAGLIKSVLMLEHGMIPPQANYQTPNPDILLDEWKLRVNIRRPSVGVNMPTTALRSLLTVSARFLLCSNGKTFDAFLSTGASTTGAPFLFCFGGFDRPRR